MKRLFFAVFGLIIVCLVGAVVAPSFIDWNQYKAQAIAEVEKRSGLKVAINGDLGFSIIPSPRFQVENVAVAAPEGSKYDNLVTFDRLDVNVSLFPLLSGSVDIRSLSLMKPIIALEAMADGSLNAMTETLANGSVEGQLEQGDAASEKGGAPAIAFNDIRIKDGQFTYYDHKTKSETVVQNINTDLNAQSLTGPFDAEGSLFVSGNAMNFDVKAERYDSENSTLPLKLKVILQPSDLAIQYDGVLSLGDDFSAQGQTAVRIEKLKEFLAQYNIQSTADAGVSLIAKGLLTANSKSLDYKNAEITTGADKANGSFSLSFDPLKYALKIKSDGDLNVQHLAGSAVPFQKGALDLTLEGDANGLKFKDTTIKAQGHSFKIAGDYKGIGKARPTLDISISAPKIDYDALAGLTAGSSSGSSSKSSIGKSGAKDAIRALALPMDLNLNLSTASLKYQDINAKDVSVSSKFSQNSFSLSKFSAKNIGGSSVTISADIADVAGAKGISSYIDINSSDVRSLAALVKVDSSAWPKDLKSATIKAKLTGSLDSMNLTTNVNAMGGEVIAQGKLSDPAGAMNLDDLTLQLKHKNMAQAVKILTGAVLGDKALTRPLDFYAKVNQSGQNYQLSDIKGDLSGTTVEGKMFVNLSQSVPKITGEFVFGKIDVSSAMSASSSGGGSGGSSSGAARWSKAAIDVSALKAVNADISLKAQKIDYGTWPVSKPSLKLTLNNGALEISDLKGGLFGGSIDTNIKVRADVTPLTFESQASFANADLGKLSAAMLGTQLVKLSGDGSVKINVKSTGQSPHALINALNGQGSVNGKAITLDGVDVTKFVRALSYDSKPGDSLKGLWKATTTGGQTAFDSLTGAFTILNGVVTLTKMDLDGKAAAIETRGTINLPSWRLNTQHKLSVKGTEEAPSDVPPFEMSFEGSLDNPSQTFGQGLLNQYLNNKVQRKLDKFLSDKLGVSSGQKDQEKPKSASNEGANQASEEGDQQPAQEDLPKIEDVAEEAIKGLLGDLLR